MFKKAISAASNYTRPVILSRKTVKGSCSSSIGAFVIVNDEGWIITAFHILEQLDELNKSQKQAADYQAQYDAIVNDSKLDSKERKRKFSKLKKLPPNATHKSSAWWGNDGVNVKDAQGIKAIDLAVARLEPFDPSWVSTYPIFKDPKKECQVGASLCKLGYPFHTIEPTWDDQRDIFALPPGSVPLPMFPIEGMFARTVNLVTATPQPFPFRFIETSTPGLKGQSGGPIFDTEGTIWAIQSHTQHYPLGFNPKVPGSKRGAKEHQFLNVGRGVHAETILGFFGQLGIKYGISDY